MQHSKGIMLTGTSHSVRFLLNKALEMMGKSAQEQIVKIWVKRLKAASRTAFTNSWEPLGTPLLFARSTLLK